MTNIVKEYIIQDFKCGNSPDTSSCVVITKDANRTPAYTIKVSDGQKDISLSVSDPVISEIAQAISDLTYGVFSPNKK